MSGDTRPARLRADLGWTDGGRRGRFCVWRGEDPAEGEGARGRRKKGGRDDEGGSELN